MKWGKRGVGWLLRNKIRGKKNIFKRYGIGQEGVFGVLSYVLQKEILTVVT